MTTPLLPSTTTLERPRPPIATSAPPELRARPADPPPASSPAASKPLARRPFTPALAVLLAATAIAAPSFAQAPAPAVPPAVSPAAAAAVSAPELYTCGVAAAKVNDWPKAYDCFLAAWKIKQHYTVGAQLGRAELKLGKHKDAADHFSFLLHEVKDLNPDARAQVQQMLGEATSKIATLWIRVFPEGAEVLVNGTVVGISPLSREVYADPGTLTIEARLPGEPTQKATVEVAAGGTRQVGLRFGVKEPPPPPLPSVAPSPPATGPSPVVIGAGIGLGAVAAILGGVFTGLAVSKEGERDEACPNRRCEDPPHKDTWDMLTTERDDFRTVAVAGFAGAALIGASTLTYALVTSRPERHPAASVGWRVHVEGAGLELDVIW